MPDMPEPRFKVDLLIRVFGMDAKGRPFSQNARVLNISDHGARFSGLENQLTPGDIIGLHCDDKKARCKVIWVADAGPPENIEVGVKIVEGQPCPWQKEMGMRRSTRTPPMSRTAPAAKDKRKFPRLRIPFPIEIRDELSVGLQMNTKTADIAGSGCYIETMVPLPVRRALNIAFWLNSERVHTTAIVRTCDGGVGMGIEFTGLDEATQEQLQEQIESLAAESAPFKKAHGAF